ncbi:GDSL-type esterase/lipase family protein [Bradyrhizobium sp. INPA03-11B]|uniref:SGNH/GDSL hydrolase family protein n=1 Tax=Bradyrhizobium sp. INPA03-11B TaxID=418598 RepID=UPI00338EB801
MLSFPRYLPWIVATVCLVSFGVTYRELHRVRDRLAEASRRPPFHDHTDVRQFIVRAALAGTKEPIVIFGDSITEMARFPEEACGHVVVNAGVGGTTISHFDNLAPGLLGRVKPYAIVVALGANDLGSSTVSADYSRLLTILKRFSPRVIAVADAPSAAVNSEISRASTEAGIEFVNPDPPPEMRFDGIHLDRAGYQVWTPAIMSAISRLCGQQSAR